MRPQLVALGISLLSISLIYAGEWTVTPQAVITKNMMPQNPMELKQPAILKKADGYKLWYAGYWGGQGLYLASDATGTTWQESEIRACVFNGLEKAELISSPFVVQDESGYKMWFVYSSAWPGPWKVGMASSFDGIEWESSRLNPVLEPTEDGDDSGSIQDVCVLKVDQTWHMWYSCQKKDDWKVEIFHATSADGVQWTREGKVSFDTFYPGLIMDPWVVREADGYVMFYVIIQGEEPPTLHSATSQDGKNWKTAYLPPLENVHSPTVERTGNGWRVWFTRDGNIWSAEYKP